MLEVSGATRVLVATSPVELRGSFNRLYGWVTEQLKQEGAHPRKDPRRARPPEDRAA